MIIVQILLRMVVLPSAIVTIKNEFPVYMVVQQKKVVDKKKEEITEQKSAS